MTPTWRSKELFQRCFTGSQLLRRYRQVCKVNNVKSVATFGLILAVDLAMGFLLARVVSAKWPAAEIVSDIMTFMDLVVMYLRNLLTWLMGAPAGLKLNTVLSQALGKFFLYHTHLWATFLYLTAPYVTQTLELTINVLWYLGLSMQLSVILDCFNVITFHVHCFYAYARRLFLSQTSGLLSLWRLFRGKKYNPLRDRVDSAQLNVEQLFIGTLAFTILLFLYPTTLVYFIVFKGLELVLNLTNLVLFYTVTLASCDFESLHLGTIPCDSK